jgi:hypothetical protein
MVGHLEAHMQNASFLENGLTDFDWILSSIEAMDSNNKWAKTSQMEWISNEAQSQNIFKCLSVTRDEVCMVTAIMDTDTLTEVHTYS